MSLTREEARYLRDHILMLHGESLLSRIVQAPTTDEARFPWEHEVVPTLPARLQDQLRHARNFSEAIHGAALLYNLLLARARDVDDLIEGYETDLAAWAAAVEARRDDLTRWHADMGAFWSLAPLVLGRVPRRTRIFVEEWLRLVFAGPGPGRIGQDATAEDLLRRREAQLKGKRSRLENRRARELWRGASGTRQLDYRWFIGSRMIADIRTGLSVREVQHA
jgi:hypothetical protein